MRLLIYAYLLICLTGVGVLVYAAALPSAEKVDVQLMTERIAEEIKESDEYRYDPEGMTEQILQKLIIAIDDKKDLSLFVKALATNEQAYIYDILVQVGFISYANQLKSSQLQDIWQYTNEKYPNRIRFAAAYAIAFFSDEYEDEKGVLHSTVPLGKFHLLTSQRDTLVNLFALARPENENSREYYLLTSVLARVYKNAAAKLNQAKQKVPTDQGARKVFSVVVLPKSDKAMDSDLIDKVEAAASSNVGSRDAISLVAVRDFLFVQTRAEFFKQDKYQKLVNEVYDELFKDLGFAPYHP